MRKYNYFLALAIFMSFFPYLCSVFENHRLTKAPMEDIQKTIKEKQSASEELQWFALKVSRKESQAVAILEKAGLRTYCPLVETDTTIMGKKTIVKRPLIPNTLFVYAPFRYLNIIKNANPFITYCYKKLDGKYKILQVPPREMELFIDSSTKMQNDITYFRPEEVELQKGDRVRIVGGVFDGYEGTLLKAKGRAKRMFLINFEMLGALGTHIEPQYIQVLK